MDDLAQNTTDMTPRRGFFRRVAGAMALGLGDSRPTHQRAARGGTPEGRFGREGPRHGAASGAPRRTYVQQRR